MRLWSLHPKYLDAKGLVALWREGLLARKVLDGRTKGYRHHPQLMRFRRLSDPLAAIDAYLFEIYQEATRRNYHFDRHKLGENITPVTIIITHGQLLHEWQHLLRKLKQRDVKKYQQICVVELPDAHPCFVVIPGEVEMWERV